MKLSGTFDVDRDPDSVLAFLADLNRLAPCLPDLRESEIVSPTEGTVRLKTGVGVVKGDMTVRLQLAREEGAVRFRGRGSGMGSALDLDASFTVSPAAAGSHVAWTGEARISGTLASMAAGLLDPVARRNVQNLMDRIAAGLQA